MRMWHVGIIPYLPNMQLKGQLRELVAIMHNWRDKGYPRHLLVNNITNYSKLDFWRYFITYKYFYKKRFGKDFNKKYTEEFIEFCKPTDDDIASNFVPEIYKNWMDKKYLRICMSNLAEKYFYGVGKNKISDSDWSRLLEGYKELTGEEYSI